MADKILKPKGVGFRLQTAYRLVVQLSLEDHQDMSRTIYFVHIGVAQTQNCCHSVTSLQWIDTNMLSAKPHLSDIWGNEPWLASKLLSRRNLILKFYQEKRLMSEMNEMYRNPHGMNPNVWNGLLDVVRKTNGHILMNKAELSKLWKEFVAHIWPSESMNLCAFSDYIRPYLDIQLSDEDMLYLYNSFRPYHDPFVQFHHFVFGMVAYDPQTVHQGVTAQMRFEYIFRFYDTKRRKFLAPQDVQRMAVDLKNQSSGNIYSACGVAPGTNITHDAFMKGIGKLNGAGLCRFPRRILSRTLYASASTSGEAAQVTFKCRRHGANNYVLAPEVFINEHGFIVTHKKDLAHAGIEMVYELAHANGDLPRIHAHFKRWVDMSSAEINMREKVIISILNATKRMFESEGKLIRMQSPIHVLGDIHGNLKDLLTHQNILWKKATGGAEPSSFLFLGDYVDRGWEAVECVTYLCCLKLLNPHKFGILRGNHEVRSLQERFTFKKECHRKFRHNGDMMWQLFNNVFDAMPVAGVIDDQVYCAHGGIPFSAFTLEQIASIPTHLPDPESQSPAAWEILWNDPINDDELDDLSEMRRRELQEKKGFIENSKRGTAYLYSGKAVMPFLHANGMSHVLRAHECIREGYQYKLGGRVTTVFSCSRYVGQSNHAACIMVQDRQLFVKQLETYSLRHRF